MRILILGAGVIGRVYGARLSLAGHDVTIVARGSSAVDLADSGIRIAPEGGLAATARLTVVTDVDAASEADLAFVAVRRDQVDGAATAIGKIRAHTVVSLIDLPVGLGALRMLVGSKRFLPAFPGVGGAVTDDGAVAFIDVRQQPTTIQAGPGAPKVAAVLKSAGFRTAIVPDMTAWLQSHAVFICAFESAIVAADGDLTALASDRQKVRRLVLRVREDLHALARQGTRVTPRSLRLIFLRVPVWFATRYWMRQLSGPLGRLGFLPHSMASRDTELLALQQDVQLLTSGGALDTASSSGRQDHRACDAAPTHASDVPH